MTQTSLNPARKKQIDAAIERLRAALAAGSVTVVVGTNGSLAFRNWKDADGVADLCAYRRLAAQNSPELRRAVMRAEAMAGRKIDQRAIAAGQHSHDGGLTWSTH